MTRIFPADPKIINKKPKIVTIRVTDLELKMFAVWIMNTKGPLSQFTREAWKTTAEWEEFQQLEDKDWLIKEVEK